MKQWPLIAAALLHQGPPLLAALGHEALGKRFVDTFRAEREEIFASAG